MVNVMQKKPLFLATSVMLIMAQQSYANMAHHGHGDTQNMVHDLGQIVVTAAADDSENVRMVRDPKQPIQPNPASDGAAYLKSLMGFNAVQTGGVNGDVTFRGMFGSRIKMLTNDSENLGACPQRMDNPTTYIAPENFDKITVIKGPQTVEFATPGSAATVQFERGRPDFSESNSFCENGRVKYRGEASTVLGSYGRWDHNVDLAVGTDQIYSRITGNRSISDDYKDGNKSPIHSQYQRWNADFALGFTPNADSKIELTAGTGDGEVAYAGRAVDGSQYKRESYGLSVEKNNISPMLKKFEASVRYNDNDHIMDNFTLRQPESVTMMGRQMENRRQIRVTRETLNSRIAGELGTEQWQLKLGIDNQRNNHGGEMSSSAMPRMNMAYAKDMKYQSLGAFTEFAYNLSPAHRLITGGRADQVKINDLQTHQQRKNTLPSGFIRYEYKPSNQLNAYIGVGHVQRTPDYWELMRTSERANTFRNLANEKTTQLDVGVQYEAERWNAWASAYAGKVNDFILIGYDATRSVKSSHNVDGKIAGGELGVGYNLTDRLSAELSAMYAWGENSTENRPLPQIAPLEGRLNLRYSQDNYSLGLLWRSVASQKRVALNQGNVVGFDVQPSQAFNILSANAVYNFSPKFNVSVGVDNLTNKTYKEHLNRLGDAGTGLIATEQFNSIGRNYWTRLNVKF